MCNRAVVWQFYHCAWTERNHPGYLCMTALLGVTIFNTLIYYTLPLFSGVSAYLFLSESIGAVHYISALFIVTGIVTANYEFKTKSIPGGK